MSQRRNRTSILRLKVCIFYFVSNAEKSYTREIQPAGLAGGLNLSFWAHCFCHNVLPPSKIACHWVSSFRLPGHHFRHVLRMLQLCLAVIRSSIIMRFPDTIIRGKHTTCHYLSTYYPVHYFPLHQALPLATCLPQSQGSTNMPINPATQIPPLSLTLVAPKLNSRSPSSIFSIISANVLT